MVWICFGVFVSGCKQEYFALSSTMTTFKCRNWENKASKIFSDVLSMWESESGDWRLKMDVLKFGAISKTCGHQFVLYKDNENRSKPIFFFFG